jgi:hypothetical protein
MFRRVLILGLISVGALTLVANASACHRCHGRGGYYVGGCGYYCHKGYGNGGYRIAKVYRTVKVPVQTCSTTYATVTDPCNPCCTKSVPTQTCTTTYVTQRILVHTQRVPAGPVYGNYTDGSRRVVWGGSGYGNGYGGYGYGGYGYGGGYNSPYRSGYGMGGGYRMGGYGAAVVKNDYVSSYKSVETKSEPSDAVTLFAF